MKCASTEYGEFYFFDHDTLGLRLKAGEFHDPHFRPVMDSLKPGDVMVDVGANIGFFTVYAAMKGVYVRAFEASMAISGLLHQNVVANNVYTKVDILVVPLYDKECELDYNPEWKTWEGRVIDWDKLVNCGGLSLIPGGGGFIALPLDNFDFQKVDLIKVDTQGADLRVLVGATDTIARCRPRICFEFEATPGKDRNASGDSRDDFKKFFADRNYVVTQLAETEYGEDYLAVPE